MLKIDHDAAKKLLSQTVGEIEKTRYAPKSKSRVDIESIISGEHLTYRYILITGLLAKAVNANANPLALQAGASFDGAYDARSLCHKVIVPLEAVLLQNKLGGSNEPYLNKPARFTHLSIENAVRKGKDLDTLKATIRALSSIKNQREALDGLKDAIHFILKRPSRLKSKSANILQSGTSDESSKILRLFDAILEKSNEGESSVLCVGAALRLLLSTTPLYEVRIHPSNQAGTSSNEICDIDVLFNQTYVYGLEVKDKSYHQHDVIHAIEKARQNGLHKMLFINGLRAKADFAIHDITGFAAFNLHVLNIKDFLATTIALCPPVSLEIIKSLVPEIATEIRAKDQTFAWIEKCMAV